MRGFQQRDEILGRGTLDLQVAAQVHHVRQPAIVQAQVQEGVLQVQHAAHAEQRGHVALEHLVDDVLAQQALCLRDAVHLRGLREATAHQVFVEVTDVGAGGIRCGRNPPVPSRTVRAGCATGQFEVAGA